MKKRIISIFMCSLLIGCTNQIHPESSKNDIKKKELPLEIMVPKHETFEEYPFDECGKLKKFIHYEWYKYIVDNIHTINIVQDYVKETP